MALARILVDGYSLLHDWTALAPGRPRHSAAAREALAQRLTQYQDACGTPLTIVFDGVGGQPASSGDSAGEVEVLYSRAGQTADQVIERAAHRLLAYGEVLVVTDDTAERDLVIGFGGMAQSCGEFIRVVEQTLAELEGDIRRLNERERQQFRVS
jgi:hypothetical protein